MPMLTHFSHLHHALIQLARVRRNTKSLPPRVVLLFTRADLSPHLANVSFSQSTDGDENKRLNVLLSRARSAIEKELGRRRVGMGFGSRNTTKVGGMSHVSSGQTSTSVWGTLKSLIGLGSRPDTSYTGVDEDEDEDRSIDYVDWEVQEKAAARRLDESTTGTSLDRLDPDIVQDGRVVCTFASVGKERGWQEQTFKGLDALHDILLA